VNCKGQFSIIAALLVTAILIATVIITYSAVRNSQIEAQPQILSAIDETNLALKEILGFTVGYYGSILQVTGNSAYARELAINYTLSGLKNIARVHPKLGGSFNLSAVDLNVHWYSNRSWSRGKLAVNYSLAGLGLYGMSYENTCQLKVNVTKFSEAQARLNVTKDENEPLANLGKQNFKFYRYVYENSTWVLINPRSEPTIEIGERYATYTIDIPPEVDADYYMIQVEDQRGLVVIASSFNRYTYNFTWNDAFYSKLKSATDATIVVELLQNGTMRWLGQNILNLTARAKPILPIPVKAIRVNQTINGVNQEVPFQIEDWFSNYKIPLSLTSNVSIFSNKNMMVFLVNSNVSKVIIWWNGSDIATQTPYAYANRYFADNPTSGILTNKRLTLTIDASGDNFKVKSKITGATTEVIANFMRANNEWSIYGSEPAYVIFNGVVRDIVHAEAEWRDNGVPDCYNFYSHVVLTLPANATYYTYQFHLIFLNSADKPRTINDFCLMRVNASITGYFGFNGIGSSYTSVNANYMYGSLFTSPSATVTVNSISFYGRSSSGTSNVKCLIVRHDDMQIIAVTSPVSVTSTAQWRTATFSSPPILSPNTQYILMVIPNSNIRLYYNTGSANQGHYDTTNSYSSPTNPTDATHNNYKYSIYCNYAFLQTENGTSSGYPTVSNNFGLFYNSSYNCWQHHWSQVADVIGTRGFGIMFTDDSNKMLYFFDKTAGQATGALKIVSDKTESAIELLPVSSLKSVTGFISALDMCWYGAVVTFDGTTPIYGGEGTNAIGLWIIVEYPPVIAVLTES